MQGTPNRNFEHSSRAALVQRVNEQLFSYRVAGSSMGKKRASPPCLVGMKPARRVRRRPSTHLVPLGAWGRCPHCPIHSTVRLSPVDFFEAALSLHGLLMRQWPGRKRHSTMYVPPPPAGCWGACYRHCHCHSFFFHSTVPLKQVMSRRRAAKLLRLPPLPMLTSAPAHQQYT